METKLVYKLGAMQSCEYLRACQDRGKTEQNNFFFFYCFWWEKLLFLFIFEIPITFIHTFIDASFSFYYIKLDPRPVEV